VATLPQIAPMARPKLSYRGERKWELRPVEFSKDVMEAITEWLWNQVRVRRQQLTNRHKKLVPEWRRLADGRPKEEKKSWPFENAANLVHQIVGEAQDDMAARVMQMIWATAPVILYKYFTKATDDAETEKNSKKAKLLGQFMDYAAYEPNELDLYAKENIWFSDSAKLGTAWLAVVPEKRQEAVYIGYEKRGAKFEDETLYEGPRVVNLRDEDVLYDPDADTPEDSEFVSRRTTLTRRELQEREFKGTYEKGSVQKILAKPDRYGPSEERKKEQKGKGVGGDQDPLILAEWDVEECYFYWYHNRKKYRLIAWLHYETKTRMNCVFTPMPENALPLVRTRLSSGEKGMNGRGLADIGKDAQEEISTTKNQRIDATTWGILGMNRVSTMNKNIDRNFKIFPGIGLPFGKDEFEHISVAEPAMHGVSQQNEQMMIQQARDRFGIGPAVAGAGAGGPIDKRGRFGSMGTFAVLQDSNTRVAHRTSDFRHSHVKLFGLLTDMYGAMGLGRKGSLFGMDDELLSEALSDYLERKVRIPIRAATASANREVTKQNELVLNQSLMMFTREAMQMMQAVASPGIPPHVQQWLAKVVKARTRLMQQIIRDFQLTDQPEEYVPNVEMPGEEQQQRGPSPAAQPDPRILQMAEQLRGRGSVAAPGQQPGMGEPGGGPAQALPGLVV